MKEPYFSRIKQGIILEITNTFCIKTFADFLTVNQKTQLKQDINEIIDALPTEDNASE